LIQLPEWYKKQMYKILDKEAEDFFEEYKNVPVRGFRINTYKTTVEEFLYKIDMSFEKVPWCSDGFYIDSDVRLSKHPYYFAGLMYLQEPSAMFPVEALSLNKGDVVLDLCAAPGGKTVQIASRIGEQGILVSNDIKSNRIKALIKNVEALGISNTIVTNNSPKELAENFGAFFDKILVDAPCSGQGMFRKDINTLKKSSNDKIITYVNMQKQIMNEVDKLLKVGGELVYSTCTFSLQENEEIISWFLKKNTNYEVVEIPNNYNFSQGMVVNQIDKRLNRALRIYPHKVKAEGHFVCKLRKISSKYEDEIIQFNNQKVSKEAIEIFNNFVKTNLKNIEFDNNKIVIKGNKLYYGYNVNFKSIVPLRYGLQLGEIYKDRFYPSAHLISWLKIDNLIQYINFNCFDDRLYRYLKGETIENKEKYKGFVAFLVDHFTLGWGKAEQNIIKNFFPKGWRLE